MKNSVVCNNCKQENPFFGLTCRNCKSYLRDRVYNIDLGKVLARLIESPSEGFKQIIFAEHKNFIVFIILLAALKFEIDSIFITISSGNGTGFLTNFILNYFVSLGLVLSVLLLFSFLLKEIGKSLGYETRFKDNFSIITYSFVPHIFALAILFPVELIMFGEYLFSTNPSPFVLKEFIAYTLLVLELLIITWSLFLTTMANYTQTKNILFSLAASIIIHSALFYLLYLLPLYL